jgi:hypothetical protein
VLTVIGKLTGNNKFFLIKSQGQVDKLYIRISKAKYRKALVVVVDIKFVEKLIK